MFGDGCEIRLAGYLAPINDGRFLENGIIVDDCSFGDEIRGVGGDDLIEKEEASYIGVVVTLNCLQPIGTAGKWAILDQGQYLVQDKSIGGVGLADGFLVC